MWSNLKRYLVGRPLTTDRASQERLTKKKALATFSSDALSSVAYATEAILVILVAADKPSAAIPWTWPITLAIVTLLWILVFSYRQTISAYPNGGGAFTVCKENLGENLGLVAAASLIIDYILTVAVSIAAGTAAVTSAYPWLLPHRVLISDLAVLILMLMNLRGIRESGTIFAIPTYLFIFSLLAMFGGLGIHTLLHPQTVTAALFPPQGLEGVGIWMVFVAFANGCTALTGVEAISNGVTAFRDPPQQNAQITLIWMGSILTVLFIGVSYFAHIYGVLPKDDETLVSQLAHILGNQPFYLLVQASTAAILFLAANTSFNDFPRVASLLAEDRYLPRQLASRGDRLVFSNGIIGLAVASMFLIGIFNAEVNLLLPMYAIGVFLSFTLSQLGMVKHWHQFKGRHWHAKAAINGLGCITTGVALSVIILTKFHNGGWIICAMIPALVFVFRRIRAHYIIVGRQLRLDGPPPPPPRLAKHKVIIPVSGIHRGVLDALYYARLISEDVVACYIDITPRITERLVADWEKYGMGTTLKVLPSPYRSVMTPLIDYIDHERRHLQGGMVTVIIPEFVTARWWQTILHNQTAIFIRTALSFKRRVVVTSVRYHLRRG